MNTNEGDCSEHVRATGKTWTKGFGTLKRHVSIFSFLGWGVCEHSIDSEKRENVEDMREQGTCVD
jgi:hypothetical protein